jgi:uncharacterized repeat protein (TIGR01451 family)
MKSSAVRIRVAGDFLSRLARIILLSAFFIAPFAPAAMAQVAPPLGTTQSFAVLGSSTVTNTGPTVITGDLGVDPGTAITGFPPGTVVGGTTDSADAIALQDQNDNTTAYNNLASQTCTTTVSTDLGGLTLVPGVYCFSSSAQLTGALTLDAGGDSSAVWIFQIGSTLTTASNSSVVLINGAQQCNVFWQVGSSATIGTTTTFVGNIFALASVTLTTSATLSGRALAQTGAVTMDSNVVSLTTCSAQPIPPTVGKTFSPATITAGGGSTLTITLSNSNATAASLTAALTDTLPAGVVVSGAATTTCSGGTASVGTSTVTLTGGSIPANGSCDVTVDVSAASGGTYINSIATGALQTTNGNNAGPAVATLTVNAPAMVAPSIGKAFSPATINAGGTSTLVITLSNASSVPAALTAALVDTMPSGVVISATPAAATTCTGGVATDTSSTVTLSAGTIPADSSCTVTVAVTAAAGGNYVNSLAAGALQTSNGNNAGPALATLTVNVPAAVLPTVGKTFTPATISAGGTSTLIITLSNASTVAASISAPLVDTMPSGLVISATPAPTTTCAGGVVADTATTLTLSAGTIPAASSCTVTASVTAAAGGNYINSLAAGVLQTSNGNNSGPAVATLSVSSPSGVNLGKVFSPSTIVAGGTSTITITLSNAGTAAAMTAPLTDTLPSGLVVSGAAVSTCGGTASTTASSVTLSGGTIPVDGSCTLTVNVIAAVAGSYFNALPAGALQTSNGNNAGPAVATLTANTPASLPVTLSKSFSPSTIKPGGVSTLTITLTNPNNTVANLIGPLTDYLPTGVVIAGSGHTNCGGKYSGSSGENFVTVTGGSIPANGSRTITVEVTASSVGTYTNTLPVGALQTNLGSNTTAAVAILIVSAPVTIAPTLTKSFSPGTINTGGVSTLTISLTNPNNTVANLTAPLIDYLPAGVVVSGNGSTNCGGKYSGGSGATTVTVSGGSIPANGSRTITVQVTASSGGTYTNTLPVGALQTSLGSNTTAAVAILIVNAPVTVAPILTKTFSPSTITAGGVSTLTITLTNPNNTVANLTAPLVDYLPAGVVVSGNGSTNCGGRYSGGSGATTVTVSGGSIPANGSRTITVQVTASSGGTYTNTLPVGALQTSLGSNTTASVAILIVSAPVTVAPTLTKSFSPSTINSGSVSTLTITLTNPNNAIAYLTAPLTDYLPSGMVIAGSGSTNCGGKYSGGSGQNFVTVTGGSIPANGSRTITVNVTASYSGSYTNTIPVGALQTNLGSNTTAAYATLTVKSGHSY